ncbi:MAG: AIPR family protein [Uliginosibacterium sp.]|nr:AIPR family protein [Uliginosibacterium sp.]
MTILATSAWSTSNTLHMENVQIVNGLQTTGSIYRHFLPIIHKVVAVRVGVLPCSAR